MAGRLSGKVAIITGSGSGMGRAAALAFAREGAKVVGCDIVAERGEAIVAEVIARGGEIASLHPVDLTDPEGAQKLASFAMEEYGAIDIVYNNAARAHFERFSSISYETFHNNLRDEVEIIFHLTRAVWPHLVARSGGSIINTASAAAWVGDRVNGATGHAAGKGAVVAMTRQLAVEGAPHGIRVNSISPGMIRTAETAAFLEDPNFVEAIERAIPLARIGEPEDIAEYAVFLASGESGYVTATDLVIDGGYTAV